MLSGDKLVTVWESLFRYYGSPNRPSGTPLEVLIKTVLSQNTNDRNRDRAYEALRNRFPHWELVLEAPEEEIAHCLRPGGLNRQKARRIKEILRTVKRRWGLGEMEEICRLGKRKALSFLLGLPGVGPKTAYCVLAFGCDMDVFPVDTHVLRITKRLGILDQRTSAEEAHEILAPLVPPGKARDLHLLLIRYGREVCKARRPLCERCLFPELCLYPQGDEGK